MKVLIIAALDRNRAIGRDNDIPWDYPADMRHFVRQTRGFPIIAGRKTFASFRRKPLPDRLNIVLTRQRDYPVPEGVLVCASLEEALDACRARGAEKVFVVGGAEIYRLALPISDEMLLTFIPDEVEADTFFPEWDESEWEMIDCRREDTLRFATYRRKEK